MSNDNSGNKQPSTHEIPAQRDDSNPAALSSELNKSFFVMDTHRPPPPIPETQTEES